MISFTGQVNYYTKVQDPRYSAFTVQNFYQPSNFYDTIEKIPDELQDSFQQGITQIEELANQIPEDINVRIVQDQFFRSGGIEVDLRKPILEQSTFKAGPIGDLQNIFENFMYEAQNKLFIEQEQQPQAQNYDQYGNPVQQEQQNPYAYMMPQNQQQQAHNQYSNPFAPVQAVDTLKYDTLYDNIYPDEQQENEPSGVPFSFAPPEENAYEQGGYEGVNNPYEQSYNPYETSGYSQDSYEQDSYAQEPEQNFAVDSSYDFNQNFDPGSIYI